MHFLLNSRIVPKEITQKERRRGSLYASLLVTFILLAETIIYSTLHSRIHENYKRGQQYELRVIEQQVDMELHHIENDLAYIGDISLARKVLSDPTNREYYEEMSSLVQIIMGKEEGCEKIRLIGADGDEVLRFEISENGTMYQVPDSLLQYKGDRYYFLSSRDLDSGALFVSALDLNMENGEVEVPYTPIIRYAKPIYDSNSLFLGLAIINYYGEHILSILEAQKGHLNNELYLVNSAGFYLKGPSSDKEWGFMLPDREGCGFFADHPDVWEQMKEVSSGTISNKSGHFYFRWIQSATALDGKVAKERKWLLVSYTPSQRFHGIGYLLRLGLTIAFFLFTPLLVLLGWTLGRYQIRLHWFLKEMHKQATYDALTGLYNRRAIMDILEKAVEDTSKSNRRCSVAFIDINDLKITNDKEGHEAGDLLLCGAADALQQSVRKTDAVARLGGDEFLVVFPNSSLDEAHTIMNRVTSYFTSLGMERVGKPWSMSWGCTEFEGGLDCADDMVVRADKIMYAHKQQMKAQKGEIPR